MHRKNKGFTLVELLVSISILAVVGLAIGGFLVVSANQYRAAGAEVKVQTEAGLVENQLKNLILAASIGIDTTEDALELYSYDEEQGTWRRIRIAYLAAERELRYTGYELIETESGTWEWRVEDGADSEFFARYVESFSVMLLDGEGNILPGDTDGERIGRIQVKVSYRLKQSAYESGFVVTPRNPVIATSDLSLLMQ